jgi:predicted amino acid racemase
LRNYRNQRETFHANREKRICSVKHKTDFYGHWYTTSRDLFRRKQDIDLDLIPKDPKISILGASSDHLLVDITDSENSYHVGDILQFDMLYTAVMRSFTSKYVDKEYIDI